MTQDTLIISSISAGLAIIGAAILSQLGRWIPNLLHRGRIEEIREAIVSTNAEKLTDMQRQINEARQDIKESHDRLDDLRTRQAIHEKLREEDKGVMHDLKDRMTRLEEKIDDRLARMEKHMTDSISKLQSALLDAIGDRHDK